VIQTLPVQRDFLLFEPYEQGKSAPLRKLMPPDLVWLAMMHRLSGTALSAGDDVFDRNANFELRYFRYRRFDDAGKTLPYRGELQAQPPQSPLP